MIGKGTRKLIKAEPTCKMKPLRKQRPKPQVPVVFFISIDIDSNCINPEEKSKQVPILPI